MQLTTGLRRPGCAVEELARHRLREQRIELPSYAFISAAAKSARSEELDLDPKTFGGAFGEGLGIFLHGEGDDLALVSPGANTPGANRWLVAWPAKELGVVVMTNGAQGEVLAMEIIAAVRREYGQG